MLSARKDDLFLPFQYEKFTSFSFLIALAETTNKMLNRMVRVDILCLVSDLRRKALNISPLSMILTLKCFFFLVFFYF